MASGQEALALVAPMSDTTPRASRLTPGTLLGGYRIEGLLGEGGMGVVHRATQLSLGRQVALKVLHGSLAADPQAGRRFLQEGVLAARCEHPHLVRVLEVGESDGRLFLAYELVEGPTLRQVLERGGPLPLATTVELAAHAAGVLAALHRAGVLHRDLKPANLFLSPARGLLVGDLGIAKDLLGGGIQTAHGMVLGTPHYMAPELALGRPASPSADLYALGVVFYECLAGAPPFDAPDPLELLERHVSAAVPAIARRRPGLPRACDELLRRALAKDPAQRFPDATSMRQALERIASEGPETERTAVATQQLSPRPQKLAPGVRTALAAPDTTKRRRPLPVAAALCLLLVCAGVLATRTRPDPSIAPSAPLPDTTAPPPAARAPWRPSLDAAHAALQRSLVSADNLAKRCLARPLDFEPSAVSEELSAVTGATLDQCLPALRELADGIARREPEAALECGELLAQALNMQVACKSHLRGMLSARNRLSRANALLDFSFSDDLVLSAYCQRVGGQARKLLDQLPGLLAQGSADFQRFGLRGSREAAGEGISNGAAAAGIACLLALARWATPACDVPQLNEQVLALARPALMELLERPGLDRRGFDVATAMILAMGYMGIRAESLQLMDRALERCRQMGELAPCVELLRHWLQAVRGEQLYRDPAGLAGPSGQTQKLFDSWVAVRNELIGRWPYDLRRPVPGRPTRRQAEAARFHDVAIEKLEDARRALSSLSARLGRPIPPEP